MENEELSPEVLQERMKKEAVRRMQLFGLSANMVSDFINSGKLYRSETFLKSIDDPEDRICIVSPLTQEQLEEVQKFEKENGCVVYHMVLQHSQWGTEWHTYLFVSKYMEEWEMDAEDMEPLQDDEAVDILAYVNTHDFCSEMGYCSFRKLTGGVDRIA